MAKKDNKYKDYGIATQSIHTGTDYDEGTGAVRKPLRMKRINESSQKIAEWLEQRENVTFVSYPGLPSNPGHELAKRQMTNGYGGVISFGVNADDKEVERFCSVLFCS